MAQTVLLNGSKFWGDLNRMHMCNVWASGRCRLGENCGCKHASWCCISARVHTCKSLVFCNCYVHLLQETQLTNFTPEWGSSCSWGAGQVVESAAKVSSTYWMSGSQVRQASLLTALLGCYLHVMYVRTSTREQEGIQKKAAFLLSRVQSLMEDVK